MKERRSSYDVPGRGSSETCRNVGLKHWELPSRATPCVPEHKENRAPGTVRRKQDAGEKKQIAWQSSPCKELF